MLLIMYLLNVKIYFLLITIVCCLPNQKKVARFDRYEICDVPPSSPYNSSYVHVKRAGYGTIIDTSFELSREIVALKVVAKLTRCYNKEQLDSCEYFTTIALKNLCAYAAAKNSILSTMVYAHKPPFICPFRKGTYICTNGTFDPNLVSFFPLENFYWKLELLFHETSSNEYLYKMCIEGQVVVYNE